MKANLLQHRNVQTHPCPSQADDHCVQALGRHGHIRLEAQVGGQQLGRGREVSQWFASFEGQARICPSFLFRPAGAEVVFPGSVPEGGASVIVGSAAPSTPGSARSPAQRLRRACDPHAGDGRPRAAVRPETGRHARSGCRPGASVGRRTRLRGGWQPPGLSTALSPRLARISAPGAYTLADNVCGGGVVPGETN